jgi:hypothetical protein
MSGSPHFNIPGAPPLTAKRQDGKAPSQRLLIRRLMPSLTSRARRPCAEEASTTLASWRLGVELKRCHQSAGASIAHQSRAIRREMFEVAESRGKSWPLRDSRFTAIGYYPPPNFASSLTCERMP